MDQKVDPLEKHSDWWSIEWVAEWSSGGGV